MNTTETVKKTLDHAASFFARHKEDPGIGSTFGYFTHHPIAPLNKKRLAMILDCIEKEARSHSRHRPLRVLDVACGGGLITCAIAMPGHRALGVDLSVKEIHYAQLFAQEELLNGIFMQADVLGSSEWEKRAELALGGKPDVVTLAYALHHLPDVEKFLEKLSHWLEPGSLLVVNEENPDSILFQVKHRIRGWIQKDTETEWHRSFKTWKSLLEVHGFKNSDLPNAVDFLPALGRTRPLWSWSLVFTARRS